MRHAIEIMTVNNLILVLQQSQKESKVWPGWSCSKGRGQGGYAAKGGGQGGHAAKGGGQGGPVEPDIDLSFRLHNMKMLGDRLHHPLVHRMNY